MEGGGGGGEREWEGGACFLLPPFPCFDSLELNLISRLTVTAEREWKGNLSQGFIKFFSFCVAFSHYFNLLFSENMGCGNSLFAATNTEKNKTSSSSNSKGKNRVPDFRYIKNKYKKIIINFLNTVVPFEFGMNLKIILVSFLFSYTSSYSFWSSLSSFFLLIFFHLFQIFCSILFCFFAPHFFQCSPSPPHSPPAEVIITFINKLMFDVFDFRSGWIFPQGVSFFLFNYTHAHTQLRDQTFLLPWLFSDVSDQMSRPTTTTDTGEGVLSNPDDEAI